MNTKSADEIPNMNGTGASTKSSNREGTVGMYTLHQWKGYSRIRKHSHIIGGTLGSSECNNILWRLNIKNK